MGFLVSLLGQGKRQPTSRKGAAGQRAAAIDLPDIEIPLGPYEVKVLGGQSRRGSLKDSDNKLLSLTPRNHYQEEHNWPEPGIVNVNRNGSRRTTEKNWLGYIPSEQASQLLEVVMFHGTTRVHAKIEEGAITLLLPEGYVEWQSTVAAQHGQPFAQPTTPWRYLFLDVETPNRMNNSICQIAAIETDLIGNVRNRIATLVQPEAPFDRMNTSIHGISPSHVSGAPRIVDVWTGGLASMLYGSIVVAHNAPFDLSVLGKALRQYGIMLPETAYACTLRYSRASFPDWESYKLGRVCAALNVPLAAHHDALCDAEACLGVFLAIMRAPGSMPPETSIYSLPEAKERKPRRYVQRSAETETLRQIKGYMEMAIRDRVISIEEALGLQLLLARSETAQKSAALSKISDTLQSYLFDGWISPEESAELVRMFERYTNPLSEDDGTIDYAGKNFMLTGDFSHGSREEVIAFIQAMGGVMLKSVTKSCDYLVVGSKGSDKWTFGNYGGKVRKAMDWQAKGAPIRIVSEATLYGR